MDIPNHADDTPPSILRHDLSDDVLSWPQRASQGFIHDYDLLTRGPVALGEFPAGLQRNSQSLEVSVCDYANICLGRVVLFVNLPLSRDLPAAVATHREHIRDSR